MTKAARKDRQLWLLEEIDKIGENTHEWKGIKRAKSKFHSRKAKFHDKDNNPITLNQFPQAMAEYLQTKQWATPERIPLNQAYENDFLCQENVNIQDTPFDM